MPRRKTQPKAETPVIDASATDSRPFDVQVHRIVEQSATVVILARSKEEAEEIVNGKFEDRAPRFLKAIAWVDGEIEQTESVVLVQERPVGKKKKGAVVEEEGGEEEGEEEETEGSTS